MTTSQSPGPTLELVRGGRVEKVFEIRGSDFHIGRRAGLESCLNDARVSRDHARIARGRDGSYQIIDLKSKGATYLDGRKLTPFQPARLVDGSRIRIVEDEFLFREPSLTVRVEDADSSSVLATLVDLSSISLSRRSTRPEAALRAILDVCGALAGGAGLDDVLNRALDGLMTAFPGAERGLILTTAPDGTLPPDMFVHRDRNEPNRPPSISVVWAIEQTPQP